jgi:hypothetical protein
MADQPGTRQKGNAGRDVNMAGRDLNIHNHAAGEQGRVAVTGLSELGTCRGNRQGFSRGRS